MIVDQLSTKEEWTPYLAYKGLAADASDEELEAAIAGDKKFCGMCPASTVYVPEGQNGSPFQSAKIKSLLAARIRGKLI
jgi:hypothetical protein